MKKSLTVEIASQKFTLRTDADEAYVKSLARYVTEKIDDAKKGARSVATQSIVILAALSIADDLFQSRQSAKEFKKRVNEKSRTLLALLEKEVKRKPT